MDDGSKGTPRITVGVDLGDRYSYLCFLDTESGEIIEEVGYAPLLRPSGVASLRSSLLCDSHRGGNPFALG